MLEPTTSVDLFNCYAATPFRTTTPYLSWLDEGEADDGGCQPNYTNTCAMDDEDDDDV